MRRTRPRGLCENHPILLTETFAKMAKHRYHSHYTLIAFVFATAALLNACSNHAGMEGPAPLVSFKTLKSETPLKLDQLSKPLLVSFWSTSCVVCLKEMPHLADVYEEFSPKGFEMVAVAMSFDQPSAVLELSEGADWPFLVALDLDNGVSEAFGEIKVTPTAFLIDRNGEIADQYVGAIDLKKFRKTLSGMTDT